MCVRGEEGDSIALIWANNLGTAFDLPISTHAIITMNGGSVCGKNINN